MSESVNQEWLKSLTDEDVTFVKRFVLSSGSLKEIAKVYGISYPTVRLRLDRLIEKIKIIESHSDSSPFEQAVRMRYAEGRIDIDTMKEILTLHRSEMEERHED